MTSKEYLSQYRAILGKIEDERKTIVQLRELASNISPVFSETHGSSADDKLGSVVARIVDLVSDIERHITFLLELKNEIEGAINSVSDETYKRLLYKRYILCETFEKIAVDMNYHYVHICRLHKRALAQIKSP